MVSLRIVPTRLSSPGEPVTSDPVSPLATTTSPSAKRRRSTL
ncbi:hypothetical protein R2601_04498 [Salipiger bermudensis HTCC2601]|uniref:Uncharacterized protein n=1 Tax=Salipiger bermudensis (strain DSM 26914 / JCM 13377 / KCTC 12554 / HTCC2601) TaxID=314265 RepID=Q0FVU6_SALBH|nr:hypothetical protein R2601_04498 [Salipiger bermudensis HTCC2601]